VSYRNRTAALASAVVLAGSTVLLTAPAVQAEVVDVDHPRKTPIGDKSAVSPIERRGGTQRQRSPRHHVLAEGRLLRPLGTGRGRADPRSP